MNLRKFTLSALVLLALTLTSCNSMRRVGKDAWITVTTPVNMIYGGGTDGYTSARQVREGLGAGVATEVVVMPFTFLGHAIKHLFFGVVHLVDIPALLIYGPAELHPYGPDIQPLDYYTGTWFDHHEAPEIDAESGESR